MTSPRLVPRPLPAPISPRRPNKMAGLSRPVLALIGLVSTVILVASGALLVASGAGSLSRDPRVTATLPAEAGLIFGSAGVQYQGVHVGSLVGLDAGVTSSRLTMQIDESQISEIPASVRVRVVPRTLFGDVFLELVPPEDPERGPRLAGGAELSVDTSSESVQLANLYYRTAALMEQLRPEQLSVALDAMSQALQGRGAGLGETIDRMSTLATELGPLVDASIAAAPQVATVNEALSAATDDVVTIMANASELSQIVLEREDGIRRLLSGGASLAQEGAAFFSTNTDNMIAVVRNGAPVVSTFAGNTTGLDETLRYLSIFGGAGARVFSSGRFDITAVPDFSDPMPYTAEDCPRYPGMDGANCGDPVPASAANRSSIRSASAERAPLGYLEQIAAGIAPDAAATDVDPSAAVSLLLAPLVRGAEVSIP